MHRDPVVRAYIAEKLADRFGQREANSIARLLTEALTAAGESSKSQADKLIERVLQGEPVQYVTGSSWFYGRQFAVTPAVLVPRPETEELVQWILEDFPGPESKRVMDVGTGSGCIAVTLAVERPHWQLSALDISEDALSVARKNARDAGAIVRFVKRDFLEHGLREPFDIIVSNPPYVARSEFRELALSVRQYEPQIALMHPSGDPLIFYRALAEQLLGKVNGAAILYAELNEFQSEPILAHFIDRGFRVEMRHDLQGKPRMLKVWLPDTVAHGAE